MESANATIDTMDKANSGKQKGIQVHGTIADAYTGILTPEALLFLSKLAGHFEGTRQEMLRKRVERQKELDAGRLPDFLDETREIREFDWKVAAIPADLQDRRVEITGPVDRKMLINALNSGANVYMADFEDSHTPTWENNIQGQINLVDAVAGTIQYASPEGKLYELQPRVATLMVRPRGWHLNEKHVSVDGKPISGSLFDFGLFFFHNAGALLKRGTAPYFYLPKLESHLEARLWNDVFTFAQRELGIPHGTIRATVLIENILAAFEMNEILYELRDHSAGLNCGRWDYIFSLIRKFRNRSDFLFPDRAQVTMTRHCMRSYVDLLIQICHRRGIHAMGGMAAQIPIKNDPAANQEAMEKVRQDKLREVQAGHDGTWVAHPGLVAVAKEIFDAHMNGPHQLDRRRNDVRVTPRDLLEIPEGTITERGLRQNIDVGIQYIESWLRGTGCVPIYNLMEDAATAEISRSQVWQWVVHSARLEDGRTITPALVRQIVAEELDRMRSKFGNERFEAGKFAVASTLFEDMILHPQYTEFLTLSAYEKL
jgi:malate synthase